MHREFARPCPFDPSTFSCSLAHDRLSPLCPPATLAEGDWATSVIQTSSEFFVLSPFRKCRRPLQLANWTPQMLSAILQMTGLSRNLGNSRQTTCALRAVLCQCEHIFISPFKAFAPHWSPTFGACDIPALRQYFVDSLTRAWPCLVTLLRCHCASRRMARRINW